MVTIRGDEHGEANLSHLRICGTGITVCGCGPCGRALRAGRYAPITGHAGPDEGDPARQRLPQLSGQTPSPDPADETVKRIPLSGGLYAYVDAADYERLTRHKWRVCAGYAARYEKGRAVFMHHEIISRPRGMVIDHRNGNRLDKHGA